MELQTIFDIGKYVFNRKTGHAGKVIGYSHQMLRRDGYMPTLRVLQGYFILKRDLRKSSPKAERRCA